MRTRLDASRPARRGPRTSRAAPRPPITAICALLTAACAGGSAPPPEALPDPGRDGAGASATTPAETASGATFSAVQVERGRTRFDAVCAECHSASEFRGTNFRYEWRRRTAWDFYRTVSTTMPEDAPGSLSDQEYADVVAWVLEMNGFAPGAADLPATEAALDQFVMDGAPGH